MNRMRSSNHDGTIPEMQSARPRRLMVDNSIIMKSLGMKTDAKNFPNDRENSNTVARGEVSTYSATPRQARNERVDNRFPDNSIIMKTEAKNFTKYRENSNTVARGEVSTYSTTPRQARNERVDNRFPDNSIIMKTEAKYFTKYRENSNTVARGEVSTYSATPRQARNERVDNRFPVNNPRTSGRSEETHRQLCDSRLPVNTKQADRSINHHDMELQQKRYGPPQSQYAGKDYRNTPKTTNVHDRQSGPFRGQPERVGNNVDFRNSRVVPDNGQSYPKCYYQNVESRQQKNMESFKPVHHPATNDKPLKNEARKPSPNTESPHSTLFSILKFKSDNSLTAQQEKVLPVSNAIESKDKENKSSPNVEQRILPVINKPEKEESKLPPVINQERQSVDEGSTKKINTSGISSPTKSPHETLIKIPKFKDNAKLIPLTENTVPVTNTVEVRESKISHKVDQERPKTVKPVELRNVEKGDSTKPLSLPVKVILNDPDSQKVTPSPSNDSPLKTLLENNTNNSLDAQQESAPTVGEDKRFEKIEDSKSIEPEPVKTELIVDAKTEKVIKQDPTVENNTVAFLKEFQSVLDELTTECFEEMVGRVQTMQIDSEERLRGCAKLTHESAVMQPHFSETYARFAFRLSCLRASNDLTLGNALVERCQESCNMIIDSINLELNKWPFSKKISLGNFKFIGELLKIGEISENLVCDYVSELLSRDQDEVSIGCICKLLSTAGKTLESSESMPKLDAYFFVLESLVGSGMSSECKPMIEGLIDLRRAHWNLSSP